MVKVFDGGTPSDGGTLVLTVFSEFEILVTVICLSFGTPKIINFHSEQNLGVPVLTLRY